MENKDLIKAVETLNVNITTQLKQQNEYLKVMSTVFKIILFMLVLIITIEIGNLIISFN